LDNKIIFAYSPKKNKAKLIEEYSVLKPETNSDSASGKSNGALFVSPKAQIKKSKKVGIEAKRYQHPITLWDSTIVNRLKDSGYKTICNKII
jgi:hypothetical protein